MAEQCDPQLLRPRAARKPVPTGEPPALPHAVLGEAGISRDPCGGYVLAPGGAFAFKARVNRAMQRGPGAKEELLDALFEAWAGPESLRCALRPTRAQDGDTVKDSLVRLLLQCEGVQTELAQRLLEALPDHQDELEGRAMPHAGMPLPKLVLSQFRWLDYVADGAALLETIAAMLQVVEAPLRRELVLVLPDLVQDDRASESAVTLLAELLREDSQFTAPVLESLSALHLDARQESEICVLVTQSVASSRAADLPAVLRFLLQHLTAENAPQVISALRSGLSLELLADDSEGGVDGSAGEALILDAILSSLRLRSDLGALIVAQLEGIKRAAEHRPVDWWLVCALAAASDAKSRARAAKLLDAKASKQLLQADLLRTAIIGHGVALRPHYAVQLQLAAGLVRSSSAVARHTGGVVYALLFHEYPEPFERQEMIGQMLTHAGSTIASEVDAALAVLVELAANRPAALSAFSSLITGVLDYLDGLTVSQARLAFELFARLAYDADEGGSRLADELQITIRKQLTSCAPRYKSLGVLGGCSLLGRLGARAVAGQCEGGVEETCLGGTAETAGGHGAVGGAAAGETEMDGAVRLQGARRSDAEALLSLMLKHAAAPDGSFGFLLHELSLLVAARAETGAPMLHPELIDLIKENITDSFETEYLNDIEALPEPHAAPRVRGVAPELALSLDGDEASIAVNVLPLLNVEHAAPQRRHALCTLSATFQLLRVCEAALSADGLDGVDAVLGCPLYLFSPSLLDDFDAQRVEVKETVCLALFYTVDWLRELVNAFCSQPDHSLRVKVVKRLRQLTWMERTLDRCLGHTPSFKLPSALLSAGGALRPARKEALEPKRSTDARAEERALKAAAVARGKGKGKEKVVALKSKKKMRAGSDVESDGETVEDLADDIAGDAGLGAGTSAGPSKPAACEKKAKKPSPKAPAGALPTLPCLARVRPCLRGLSLDVSRLLTFSAISEQPESEELELVEALTPPAVHYLVSQLFDTVKLGLADASSMSVVRGSTSGAPTRAQDLSAMERRRLTPAALLARLKPALLTFRVHMKVLAELIPTTLRESDVVDAEAAFGGREDDQLNTRFVEPALLLLMQSLRAILESRQLSDECSQRELVDILAAFDNEHPADHVSLSQPPPCDAMHVESVGSQVRPSSGTDPAAACAAAFDFFDVLFSTMPSIALQSELIALARAILGVLMRHTPSDAEEVAARRARLSDLASSCLQVRAREVNDLEPPVTRHPSPITRTRTRTRHPSPVTRTRTPVNRTAPAREFATGRTAPATCVVSHCTARTRRRSRLQDVAREGAGD